MKLDLERIRAIEPRTITDERHDAAVLIPVIERNDEQYLLFTKRSDDLGKHPGQMSFPGGGREPEDADILETALREANEEISLDPADAQVVGRLDDIRTITEYAVTPIVARVPDQRYVPDESEVAEIAVLPLSALLDFDNYESEYRDHPHYGEIVIHYFHVDGYTVWGATGRIVADLFELTTDWRAPVRADRDLA